MATTRASLKLPVNPKQQQGITAKRKAEASPGKNERIKRCALTNLTNNLIRNESDENLKKVTVFGNKDDNQNQANIQPISYRTRASVAASHVQPILQLKPQIKVPKKVKNDHKIDVENVILKDKEVKSKTNANVNVDKSKRSISTRRISNDFEKTEESLYVSALEDISSDASRLSHNRTKNLPSSASSLNSTVTSSQASIFTTASDTSVDTDIYEDAISRKLPKGIQHFDREHWNDPFQVSHYAMDIFEYLKHQEAKYQIKDYMSQQPEITKWMRCLLVDWMVEVQESFELNHETLYLAIKIVDTYLGHQRVSKDSLQLLGAASLLIACKYDERTPPLVDDFLFICDGAYKRNQLLKMETNVFRAIRYDLGFPLSYRFLRRYARCGKVSMVTLTLARYILEYSLMDYSTIQLSDTKMACAALFMSLRMNNCEGWNEVLEYYSGYRLMDFAPIVVLLNTILHKKPKETLSTVRNKYSHKIFHQVTKIPLLDINKLFENFPDVTQNFTLTNLTYQSVIASCSSSTSSNENSKESALYRNAKEQKIETKSIPLPQIR
ncbi:hypothetical protein ACKWTF_003100 [Chironomus riparius]